MDLSTFFEKFTLFADAPDAVAKMRELMLELAVRGQLSERKAADQSDPAWRTLLSSEISNPEISDSDLFGIPNEWRWARIGDIADACGQKTPDSPFTYIDVGAIDNTRGLIKSEIDVLSPEAAPSRARKLVRPGTVIYATVRPYLKNIAIIDHEFSPPAIVSTAFAILHPKAFTDVRFLFYWLRSKAFEHEVAERMKGVAYPAINDGEFRTCPIPLPPLPEQKRIVAKVDELMALCDRLEEQQQERETRHAALARASLARFAEAPTPANLDFLFHQAYAISPADLHKSILTLAVQGKLVPQDPEEGDTRTITIEELVGRKNLKNGLSLSPIAGASDFVCLPLSAMKGSTIDCSFGKPIAINADRASPYLIKTRDVFIIRGNGSKERVGIAGMARECPPNVLFPDLFIRIPLPPDKIEGDYFLIAWNSPVTREMLENLATTTAGIWKVNQGHIAECEIPLPPLIEQRRIVNKVDQLMTLVDQLETQLATARSTAANLLDALVARLTGTPSDRKVVSPKSGTGRRGRPRKI